MIDYRTPLNPNNYYHIFNHAVGKENLFVENKNYLFFLNKFEKYLADIVDVLSYCLMPNHFHLLIRVKENVNEDENINLNCQTPSKVSDSSIAFKKLFTSYTNSFNKVYNRRGSLFQPRYKRLLINDNVHLLNTIIYIHNNPVLHGFVKNNTDWLHSSYNIIIENNKIQWLKSDEVIGLFDNVSNFIFCHNKVLDLDQIEH